VQDAPRNHEVVAAAERQVPERRLEHALAVADVHDLVALGVAVEQLVAARGLDERQRHVVVEQQRNAIARHAAPGAS